MSKLDDYLSNAGSAKREDASQMQVKRIGNVFIFNRYSIYDISFRDVEVASSNLVASTASKML